MKHVSATWKFFFVQGLTLVRVPLIFVFLAIILLSGHPLSTPWFLLAILSLIVSALTDLLDGYFARRLGVTSRLGSYADPLTDKIFYLTSLPSLIYLAGRAGDFTNAGILLLLSVLFLLRDQWVTFLRSLGALHALSAAANWSGKARTLISFPTICVVFFYLQVPATWRVNLPKEMVYGLEVLSVAINMISIAVYTRQYYPALRAELVPQRD